MRLRAQGILLHHVATWCWDIPSALQGSKEEHSGSGQQPFPTHTQYRATRRTKGCKSKLDQPHIPGAITNKDRSVFQSVRRTRPCGVAYREEALAPIASSTRVSSPSPADRGAAAVDGYTRPQGADQIWQPDNPQVCSKRAWYGGRPQQTGY